MMKLALLAGVAALAASAPALAKPGMHGNAHANAHANVHAAAGHSTHVRGHLSTRAHARTALAHRFGQEVCPPGLAKKTPACIPPGQVRSALGIGARVPTGWGTVPYSRIPLGVRDQYDLMNSDRYIYRNGTLYVVDPRTRLVERIITALSF